MQERTEPPFFCALAAGGGHWRTLCLQLVCQARQPCGVPLLIWLFTCCDATFLAPVVSTLPVHAPRTCSALILPPALSLPCVSHFQVAAMKSEAGDKGRAASSSGSGANPLLAGTKFDPFAADGEEVSWVEGRALACLMQGDAWHRISRTAQPLIKSGGLLFSPASPVTPPGTGQQLGGAGPDIRNQILCAALCGWVSAWQLGRQGGWESFQGTEVCIAEAIFCPYTAHAWRFAHSSMCFQTTFCRQV